MTLEEKLSKVDVLSKTILELKSQQPTSKTKLHIQKLQQEIDKIINS